MLTIKQYQQIVNDAIRGIDYPAWLPGLYDPIQYAMSAPGKRLRPVLMLACCDAFDGDLNQCVWPAVGIEIFHNFTLVHDDVMDKADTRRGLPTVVKKWDTNTAILSGDAMVSMAYRSIADCPVHCLPEVINRFSQMTMNVYEGQQLDADFETAASVTFDQYRQMVIGKTSALIAYPCALGALIAGASEQDISAVFNFGISLGIAFQMQDDYLDVYGDPATFGKAIGGDILNDKKTWLRIIASDKDSDGVLKQISAAGLTAQEKIEKVTALFNSLGLREYGTRLISQYTADACSALEESSMSMPAKAWLIDFATNLIHRNK